MAKLWFPGGKEGIFSCCLSICAPPSPLAALGGQLFWMAPVWSLGKHQGVRLCATSPATSPCLTFRFLLLLLERERAGKGGREGEKNLCEREASIGCLLYVVQQGTEPATQARALTSN